MKFLSTLFLTVYVTFTIAQDSNFIEEDVLFTNGDVTLNGTFIRPSQIEKGPTIVYLHGSGPHERAGFRPYAEAFAKLGFASLFFDKRGTGTSGGSWITSSLKDLAWDAVSAVDYVKSRSDVDATQIGFWGVSQAGWVAPYAASLSDDIKFMIVISGGGASPKESELFSYNEWFSAMSFSDKEKAMCLEIIDLYMDFLSTGEGRNELAERLESVSNKNVQMLAKQLKHILPSEKNRRNWEWVANYDPTEHLEKLDIPVLLLNGDDDANQPTQLASSKWQQAFKERSELLTSVVFPGAGHGIRLGGHHGERPFADGYWEVQFGWLWRVIIDQ